MVVDAASHSIIDPGSKADIRPTYQPSLLSPRRTLFTLPRVVPWSLPLEDYGVGTSLSSPRVLSSSTRSHTEASAALSSTFSSLSYPSPLSPLVYHGLLYVDTASSLILDKNFRSSHIKVPWSNPNVRVRPLHSPPVRVFWFSVTFFFPPLSEFYYFVSLFYSAILI